MATLARRVHEGAAHRHAATEKDLAAVREAVKQQWEKEQAVQKSVEESQQPSKKSEDGEKSQTNEQDQTKSSDQSQSSDGDSQGKTHGHSY